jgi:phosphate transport system permease protein
MQSRISYTGRVRQRKTRWAVRGGEILSRLLITVGGIGTIVAVALVCVFLVWVVYPLFLGATVTRSGGFSLPDKSPRPLRLALDDYEMLAWQVTSDGNLIVFRLDTGKVLERRSLFPGARLTACSSPSRQEHVAFGFADGTVRLGKIGFASRFLESGQVPAEFADLQVGDVAEFDGGLITRTPEGQLRTQKIKVDLEEPIKPPDPAPVALIDLSMRTGPVISLLTTGGTLRTTSVSQRENLLTGETIKELTGGQMALPRRAGKGPPKHLLLSGVGDNVYLVWEDGHLLRINTRDLKDPRVAEEVDLLGGPGVTLTALRFLIGKASIVAGDSTGRLRVWFLTRPPDAATPDRLVLTRGHDFPGKGSPVTALAASARTRILAAGHADGSIQLFNVTSEKFLGEVWPEGDQPVMALALAPKDNGLLAQTATGITLWSVEPGHSEITLRSLYRPVWYEGYVAPEHVWQTTGGSDDVEPKFGMWPLIFGTLKATVYSLLLGVPLALLAAIYTSEFLHPRTRAVVKPTIELMASLPSVVLGFIAALVLAPFVSELLPAVLCGFITIPGAFFLGAYLWQLLPDKLSLFLARYRFPFICLVLPVGVGGAALLGPLMEQALFQGNLKGWLDGHGGNSTSGWFLLLLPFGAFWMAVLMGQVVNPRLRHLSASWGRFQLALLDLGKFLVGAVLTAGISGTLAVLLNALGFDPRGSVVATYGERNALVVGFMMGFAIIPIIYTLADDALTSVPEYLRSASLGCGATPWQTAVRIVIPTAMSGLFSAVMVGLGRAVGETMIVLMAAGNTPVMEWNIFSGFRTLSAAIAVELPEAVRDSTHYRTLFLAGLTLFAMTFVLNTVAEVVRQRFRKRAFQL